MLRRSVTVAFAALLALRPGAALAEPGRAVKTVASGAHQLPQHEGPGDGQPTPDVAAYDTSEARGTWKVPLRGLRVLSLARTADGQTWFAGKELEYPNAKRVGRVLGDTVAFVPYTDVDRSLEAPLVADPQGGVWFGQLYWNGSEWVDRSLPFASDQIVVYDRFFVGQVAGNGERWYALQADCQGFGGGVYLERDGVLRHISALFAHADEGFVKGNFVNVIAGRPNGEIWFGTGRDHCMQMDITGGLTSFDGTSFRLQTVADGLAHPYVRDIAFARDTVWVATDGGLSRFHGDAAAVASSRGVSYTTENSALPHGRVRTVAVDSTGAVWLGTQAGAARFAGHWTWFDSTSGLPGSVVHDILVDPEDGRIWMATDDGIAILTHEPTPRVRVTPPAEEGDEPSCGTDSTAIFYLGQSWPNPMRETAEIRFCLDAPGPARLTVYNTLGQRVRVLTDDVVAARFGAAVWDGCDDDGRAVGNGVYLYRLTTASRHASGRLVLLR